MVTGWDGERGLFVTSPGGREQVSADAIIIATGARERPRAARWIPGDRPAGVFTTGELQQAVHLEHQKVGGRAVVVGSELVSWSAVLTLRSAKVKTVAMVTESPRPEAYAAFTYPGKLLFSTPLVKGSRVVRVIGRGRVSGVEIERVATGQRRVIACDMVVFTGDWIPDHELVRLGGIELDPATLGPRVDGSLATSRPAVFAAGNVIHPVDTADVAALDGAHVARTVLEYLGRAPAGQVPAGVVPVDVAAVGVVADAPFKWVTPSLVRPGGPAAPRERLLLWPEQHVTRPALVAKQDGQVIGKAKVAWPAAPGRVFRAPWGLVADARPGGGEVHIGLN